MAVMKKDPCFLFSFVSFLLLCSSTCSLSSQPRNPEVVALINIKNELHDPRGVLNNWDEFSVDPCSWTMISCSPDNLVTGLYVFFYSLSLCFGFENNINMETKLLHLLLQLAEELQASLFLVLYQPPSQTSLISDKCYYRTITSLATYHRNSVLYPSYRLWIFPITGFPAKFPVRLTSSLVSYI